MSTELSDHIFKAMGDRETIVVLETEFNKQGIETYEPFDAYLAEVVEIFHRQGNVKVVIGFGNWAPQHWSRFDRAVGEAGIGGTQLLQSSYPRMAASRRRTAPSCRASRRSGPLGPKPTSA